MTVRLFLSSLISRHQMAPRQRAHIGGRVGRAHAGAKVRLQRWTGQRWRNDQKRVIDRTIDHKVGYRFTVRRAKRGTYRFRVVAIPDQRDRVRPKAPAASGGRAQGPPTLTDRGATGESLR